MSKSVPICVIGSGYVGLVAAVCFAEMGHHVICVDNDEAKVKILREGGVPIFENQLPELLAKHRGLGVEFTSDLACAVERSDAIFIAVGTPQGDTGAADLSYVEAVVSEIARHINSYKVIVEKSTVPVYTNEWIERVLQRHGVDSKSFDVVSNPEFLREGTAVIDFLHPDRIVVGANNDRAAEVLRRIYAPLTTGSYYDQPGSLPGTCTAARPARLVVTSAQSAEIIKHASNAFLALKISFINAVANLAEAVDADIEDIAAGHGTGQPHRAQIPPRRPRIRWLLLSQGRGRIPLGGAAARRQLQAPAGDPQDQRHPARHLLQQGALRLVDARGKQLAALGLAFKGDTDDIRDSPAIEVIKKLLEAGATITAYDPAAMERARDVLPPSNKIRYAEGIYEAAKDADAVLILTDWKEFADLTWSGLTRPCASPSSSTGATCTSRKRCRNMVLLMSAWAARPAIMRNRASRAA